MAKLRFEIEGTPSTVAFSTYIAATTGLQRLLRELDEIISSRFRGTLDWYVTSLRSEKTLSLDIVSRVRQSVWKKNVPLDAGAKVASSFVTGLDNIQNRGTSPPYLSEYGLKNLQSMLHVLNKNGAIGYVAREFEENRSVRVLPRAEDTIRQLLPVKRLSVGSAEGRLEAISIRRDRKFIVYDSLTDKAVTCLFHEAELDKVKMLLGARVVVAGMVHTNMRHEPVRVDVEEIRVLNSDGLPTTKDLTGAYPAITAGLSVDEYIRSLRD